MRVIIAGGRDFSDYNLLRSFCLDVFRKLKTEGYDTSRENVTIVSGKAKGADSLGELFQQEFSLSLKEFPANWKDYGKRAGPIRNMEMAQYAEEGTPMLIAFWDGKSRGTQNMINNAKDKGIPVFVCKY